MSGYYCDADGMLCIPQSPVLLDLGGNGFSLTAAQNGVTFDLSGYGQSILLAWTAAGSDDAWLALDRNGNGTIDNGQELFGNYTPQPSGEEPNGFRALALFDSATQGGNGDGRLSVADSVYAQLRLWTDINHNGISEPSELFSLSQKGILEIALNYRKSSFTDVHGNRFAFKAKVKASGGSAVDKWAFDVFSPASSRDRDPQEASVSTRLSFRVASLVFLAVGPALATCEPPQRKAITAAVGYARQHLDLPAEHELVVTPAQVHPECIHQLEFWSKPVQRGYYRRIFLTSAGTIFTGEMAAVDEQGHAAVPRRPGSESGSPPATDQGQSKHPRWSSL